MTYYTREQWAARDAKGGPGALDPDGVEGVALHWPAMQRPLKFVEEVKAALRGWQNFHMDDRGWSDIAYQEAFDQLGNVYELRGIGTQSGANGDTDVNERFGAFLLILAPGEEPSELLVKSVKARIAKHRERFPKSERIVGHGEIRPGGTECPGPIAQAAIDAGEFEPGEAKTGPSPRKQLRKSITKDIKTAKEQGRPKVVEDLQDARARIPKDDK
jgi:hypothetical protein